MWYRQDAADDDIIGRMRIAFWITRATDTHSENVFHCFSAAKWLSQRASIIRCSKIAPLVLLSIKHLYMFGLIFFLGFSFPTLLKIFLFY